MNPVLGHIAPSHSGRLNLLLDLAAIVVSMCASMALTGGTAVALELYARLGVCLVVWVLSAAALHHYDPWADERDAMDDALMTAVLSAATVTTLFVLNRFASGFHPVPRTIQTLTFLLPTVVLTRLFIFRPLYRRGGPLDEVLVMGVGSLGRITGQDLEKSNRRRVLGYMGFEQETKSAWVGSRYLGKVADLEGLLATMAVNEVYIAGDIFKSGPEMQQIIKVCERQGVPFALPASQFRFERAHVHAGRSVRDGYQHYLPFHVKPRQMAFKRLFDVVSSGAALWALIPVMALIALAIKLTSRGPVFFGQTRVGLNGRQFRMLKFRSMVTNAEELKKSLEAQNEQTGPVFKMKKDPRITAVGRFIRKYSLDELPQLINVLRGDMSVVGPRPPVPQEVAKYEPWQRRRLSMRPGLTCIWQVSGRNQISFEQWMYLDMLYIDHWNFALDMNLIFKTVPVVAFGRGAS